MEESTRDVGNRIADLQGFHATYANYQGRWKISKSFGKFVLFPLCVHMYAETENMPFGNTVAEKQNENGNKEDKYMQQKDKMPRLVDIVRK